MAQGRDGNFEEGRTTKVMLPIPIYKGDSTDAFGVRVIKINLKTELVLTNATATFTLLSFKKNFTSAELATKVLKITIPAEVTKGFPLGNVYGKLCLYDSSLRVLTAACHIPFRIELAGSGIYGGWCAERTPLAEVTVEAGVDYALAYNKPTINNVVVDGDKTASDYGLALLSQIPTMLSQLQSDATHRTVTDAEKSIWNNSAVPDIATIRANAQLGANHSRLKDNPHQVSKSQVGLGNVDNTSDANKPVSTAQQTALNGKVDKVDGKGLSEKDFTASDKSKLDGIETGAQKNVNANWTSASGSAGFIQNKPKCEIVDLPEEFTEDEMRTKLNALLGWMRTNFAVLTVGVLMAASTFAEPAVLTARKGSIPNTANIVTNVTGLSDLASKQSVSASVEYTTSVSNKLENAIARATPGDYYNVSNKAYTALQQTDILNVTDSTATDKALSANMGKELQDQITNLKQRGRYLSVWNSATGRAQTTPTVSPYIYKAGDYFIVGVVSTNATPVNYRPVGTNYVESIPSTTVETNKVIVNDTYYYDGASWTLLHTEQKEVAFSTIAGSPYDNTALSSELKSKIDSVFAFPSFTAKAYANGDYVTSEGKAYRCKLGYTATAASPLPKSDETHWASKSITDFTLPAEKDTDGGYTVNLWSEEGSEQLRMNAKYAVTIGDVAANRTIELYPDASWGYGVLRAADGSGGSVSSKWYYKKGSNDPFDGNEIATMDDITVRWDDTATAGQKLKHGDTSVTASDVGAVPASTIIDMGNEKIIINKNIVGIGTGQDGKLFIRDGDAIKYGTFEPGGFEELATIGDITAENAGAVQSICPEEGIRSELIWGDTMGLVIAGYAEGQPELWGAQLSFGYGTEVKRWTATDFSWIKYDNSGDDVTLQDALDDLAPKSMISATDNTFKTATTDIVTKSYVEGLGIDPGITAGVGLSLSNGEIKVVQTSSSFSRTNLSVVGSSVSIGPNGEATGFTTSSYILIDKVFSPGSSPWSIETKVLMPTSLSVSRMTIVGSARYNYDPVMVGTYNRKFEIDLSSGTSSQIAEGESTFEFALGATYWVKVSFTGTKYVLEKKLYGERNYSEIWSHASSTPVFGGDKLALGIQCTSSQYSRANPFKGTIYLSDTKVMIGNEVFYSGSVPGGTVAKATDSLYGLVKPDISTISVSDGVIGIKEGVITNEVANSTSLWNASNAKLTAAITNTVTKPYVEGLGIEAGVSGLGVTNIVNNFVSTNTTLFVTNSALTIAQGGTIKWQESFGGYKLAASSADSVSCADHSTTFVTATGTDALTITPPAANSNGDARDFICVINTSGTNALNLAAFTTLYATEESATNAVQDKVTMLYFTEMKANEWLMSRQEVVRVRP